MASELRQIWRSISRHPAGSGMVILTLAAGLTVSAALFAILDGLLMKPLPLDSPGELFVVGRRSLVNPSRPSSMTYNEVESLAALPGVAGSFGYSAPGGFFDLETAREEGVREADVTPGFFEALGRSPRIGRQLDCDDSAAEPRNVVISHELWQRRFGGDSAIVGRLARLGGRSVTVAGVMGPGFDFPGGSNVWLADATARTNPRLAGLIGVVRVPGGVPPVLALSSGERTIARPLHLFLRPGGVSSLVTLFFATALLVLLTWVHLGGFALSESALHAKDLALEAALGAGWGRLAAGQFARTLVLSLLAMTVAWVAFPSVLAICVRALPAEITLGQPIAPDYRSLLYLAVLTGLGALVVGSGPLVVIRHIRLTDALAGRISASGRASVSRLTWTLLAAEVALVTVLVYVAGLATRSLIDSGRVDLGVVPDRVISIDLPPATGALPAPERVRLLREQVQQMPGVKSVAEGEFPVGASRFLVTVSREGMSGAAVGDNGTPNVFLLGLSPGYFATVGARVLEGTDAETATRADAVALSESVARSLKLASPRVGARVLINGMHFTVVAVVADVRWDGPEAPPAALAYAPGFLAQGGLVVKTESSPGQVTPGVLAVVRRVTGDKGPIRAQLAVDACRRTTARSRSRSTFLGIFGLSSFLLGITGVFSAATEAVRRDKRHTAIRMALGASRQKVVGGVLWKTLSVVACGAAVGLLAGLSVGRSLQGVVFGILPADMLTAASTFASLLSVAAVAAAVPALAASRVDPLTVLRNE